MNPPHRWAVDPDQLLAVSDHWMQQAYDLRSAAGLLSLASTGTAGLPATVAAGLRHFLIQWSAEIDARAAEVGDIPRGLDAVTTTSVATDQRWASGDAWGAAW